MWKTLVGKFQPLPASSYPDSQTERDLENSWDERDTAGVPGTVPENATSHAQLAQYVFFLMAILSRLDYDRGDIPVSPCPGASLGHTNRVGSNPDRPFILHNRLRAAFFACMESDQEQVPQIKKSCEEQKAQVHSTQQ